MAPLSSSSSYKPHIVVFPFMSKGHTIPLLHLAQLLLDRGLATVTIFTTLANHPFISQSLAGADVSIVDLPFPHNIQGVPPGAESTDKLPSMALFLPFVRGLELMQPAFEQELQNIHSQVTCIISDGFLPWTLESASRLGIPRLSYYGMSYYSMAVSSDAGISGHMSSPETDDDPFTVKSFPWIQLTRNDFDEPFNRRDPSGPHLDFIIQTVTATANSYGLLVNTFYDLEQLFADYCNHDCRLRTWSIGPLCLAKLQKNKILQSEKPRWMHWLDRKLAQESPVLYIAFGSQASISPTQLQEIALGLEGAEVSFLWVVKKSDVELLSKDFQSTVSERGIIVTDWVDQEEILEHPIVQGFLSHCGWNSVLDGICAGVPILAWPMMAEQGLNAKMVVEEIKVGLRIGTVDGKSKGFVTANNLKSAVRELMDSGKGRQLRERVKEIAKAAIKATSEGGSSWNALSNLISEIQREKEINSSKLTTVDICTK
ncbi:UDP-glycosyltransferase 90A1-like [Salvia miltiorrhiza]|uniref:UDP-glycosyltransferase 90A1-like n=1 Tax=Salvia miltiorrhiza TaxID=226208 RepID=UPI0025AC2ACC|nr:UDP-glycosyltransferase 90A1-like [Salvia miltiorrhiza]